MRLDEINDSKEMNSYQLMDVHASSYRTNIVVVEHVPRSLEIGRSINVKVARVQNAALPANVGYFQSDL